ncbi:MAG: hypothetical protein HRU43_05860 [Simkaniaceae bacterium]|nr:hypothetical protein [Simkaniaceae bacterium]
MSTFKPTHTPKKNCPTHLTKRSIFSFILTLQSLHICSASNIQEGTEYYQDTPSGLQPDTMYKATYILERGLEHTFVPENLGKEEEMRALIQKWKSKTPDSLERTIQNLTIVEITEKELHLRD